MLMLISIKITGQFYVAIIIITHHQQKNFDAVIAIIMHHQQNKLLPLLLPPLINPTYRQRKVNLNGAATIKKIITWNMTCQNSYFLRNSDLRILNSSENEVATRHVVNARQSLCVKDEMHQKVWHEIRDLHAHCFTVRNILTHVFQNNVNHMFQSMFIANIVPFSSVCH